MLSSRLSRVGCSAAVLVVAATSAVVLQTAPAVAAPAACATASVEVEPTEVPPLGWLENIAFDRAGDLWTARSYRSVLERHDTSGRLTATVPVPFPAAVRLGPDGLLYVNSTPSPLDATVRSGNIVTVDPATAQLNPTPFATGLGLANGATIDSAGNHYIADSARGVTRIGPDGTVDEDWTAKAPKGIGYNGIAGRGDALYVTMLFSSTTRVVRVPISNPEQSSVAADLISTPGFLPPLFPDDLAASRTETCMWRRAAANWCGSTRIPISSARCFRPCR